MTKLALEYYLKKATAEIYEFVDKSRYGKISVAKDDILYYSGQILFTQKFVGDDSLCNAAVYLTPTTFCVLYQMIVPLLHGQSYKVNKVHWYHFDVKHGGTESVLR